jgi:hypothetical protein
MTKDSVFSRFDALTKLEEAIPRCDDVFVNRGVDEATYLASLAADIRAHLCEPFAVDAKVVEPGFPFANVGQTIQGFCIAQRSGYWLVYQPKESRFLCFRGESASSLGAAGVFGSPLYCWSA